MRAKKLGENDNSNNNKYFLIYVGGPLKEMCTLIPTPITNSSTEPHISFRPQTVVEAIIKFM